MEVSENCLEVFDFMMYFVHVNDFFNMYRCLRNTYQEKWCFCLFNQNGFVPGTK